MCVQFGRWNFDGVPVSASYCEAVKALLAPYAPDGITEESSKSCVLLFGAFHTTEESAKQSQPFATQSGDWVMFDGRLDNPKDCARLAGLNHFTATDLDIAAAVSALPESSALGHLIGDWALSAWSAKRRQLILARDFLGTRHLYYFVEARSVTWCTILDPLVTLGESSPAPSEEYLAGWIAEFPKASLTPYQSIFAVPPASSVKLGEKNQCVEPYWSFNPHKRFRLKGDREYEQIFLSHFRQSVVRRLRSDRPILAELSGGIDSSSIVCVADELVSGRHIECPRIDTISFYSDSEPNWNERPFFTAVERQRGRAGCHIDSSRHEPLTAMPSAGRFFASPASSNSQSALSIHLSEVLAAGLHRVILSGVGGDEVTGGLPSPLPELADLLFEFRIPTFLRRLVTWSLAKRTTVPRLLSLTAKLFLLGGPAAEVPWLNKEFARRNREALAGYRRRLQATGATPSFQLNLRALESIRRQLCCTPLPTAPLYEKRYPFLDRDFLEFCFSIPREQFVRPGERRSLLRRSMAGIVPDEILRRKRKAFVTRRLTALLTDAYDSFVADRHEFLCARHGIVEPRAFFQAFDAARRGNSESVIPIVRTIALEQWLRSRETPRAQTDVCLKTYLTRSTRSRGNGIPGREKTTEKGGESREIQQA